MLAIFLLACFVASQAATAGPVPLVMWHGMGESVTPTVVPYVVITQATWSDSRLIFLMFCVLVGYEDEHAATTELSPCWSM